MDTTPMRITTTTATTTTTTTTTQRSTTIATNHDDNGIATETAGTGTERSTITTTMIPPDLLIENRAIGDKLISGRRYILVATKWRRMMKGGYNYIIVRAIIDYRWRIKNRIYLWLHP